MVQVAPLQRLATDKHQTTDNRGNHPANDFLFGVPVTRFDGQHHGHGAHDQNEGHDTHENQRVTTVRNKRNRLKHFIRVGPGQVGKPLRAIINQECGKSEGVRDQKKPHHDFAVLHVKRRSASAPPSGFHIIQLRYSSAHCLIIDSKVKKHKYKSTKYPKSAKKWKPDPYGTHYLPEGYYGFGR